MFKDLKRYPHNLWNTAMVQSLRRGFTSMLTMFLLGFAALTVQQLWPTAFGPLITPYLYIFGSFMMACAIAEFVVRVIQAKINTNTVVDKAMESAEGAGLIFLGRMIFLSVVVYLSVTSVRAAEPPNAALPYLPILKAEQTRWWPAMPLPSALGAQVEQETCITLTHRTCWNPRAELKTTREYGFGLGQITVTDRFNVFKELQSSFPAALGDWKWENRFDSSYQLRAIVMKDRQIFQRVLDTANPFEQLAMTFAAYNGGEGGMRTDRRVCAGTKGCDHTKWFGHVEFTSLKLKTPLKGYGKSFFQINREYPDNIIHLRRPRYLQLEV